MTAENLIKRQEGFRSLVYQCPAGKSTIGYGRNVDDGGQGISETEATFLLRNDIRRIQERLAKLFSFFSVLDSSRRAVLISMAYNMGVSGLCSFRKTLGAVAREQYDDAAIEMLDSKWARQVPNRALELSEMMRSGKNR